MKRFSIVLLFVAGIALIYAAVLASGAHPSEVFSDLVKGSLGSGDSISRTLVKTTPLLIAGIAVYIGLRAGLFNIGVEGQLVMGALTCGAIAARVHGVGGAVLGAAGGIVVGALWALPAGLIKAYRGGHEVITTIMLNSVAGFVSLYLLMGPLREPGQDHPTTAALSVRLPNMYLGSLTVNSSLVVAILATLALAYWLRRTVAGYELEAVGQNPTAAEFAGIDRRKVVLKAMVTSGAVAGIAGVVQVLAFEGRFFPEISSGIGFDALGVALLAGSSPLALIGSAFGFGALAVGGTDLAIDGVPKGITGIVLGVVIVLAAAVRYRKAATIA